MRRSQEPISEPVVDWALNDVKTAIEPTEDRLTVASRPVSVRVVLVVAAALSEALSASRQAVCELTDVSHQKGEIIKRNNEILNL